MKPVSARAALSLVVLIGAIVTSRAVAAQGTARPAQAPLPAQGTATVWGTVSGIAIEGLVEGPSTAAVSLQVACVFEYTESDIFRSPPALAPAANGMLHLDAALKGAVTELRKNGKFTGHALETLLITPPPGAIAAKQLLLIGLGDRRAFTPQLMIAVGSVSMREALRLGVTDYAFASDLKDAGVDSPTALVAGNVVKGALDAYRIQRGLKDKGLSDYRPITRLALLAGPPFFAVAGEGIKEAIAALNKAEGR